MLVLDPSPRRTQAPHVDPHIVLIGFAFVTDLLQHLGKEVEQGPQLVEILDHPGRLEVEFVHARGELAQPSFVCLDGQANPRLGIDEATDLLVVEEAPHAPGLGALDHEVLVEPSMADPNVLHSQRLPQAAEDARPVDLEPEALRIEVRSAQSGEGLVRVAAAHRVRVERDDPVAVAGLDGGCGEKAAFVEASAHLPGQLSPDLLLARPEEGLENAHPTGFPALIAVLLSLRSSQPHYGVFHLQVGLSLQIMYGYAQPAVHIHRIGHAQPG